MEQNINAYMLNEDDMFRKPLGYWHALREQWGTSAVSRYLQMKCKQPGEESWLEDLQIAPPPTPTKIFLKTKINVNMTKVSKLPNII